MGGDWKETSGYPCRIHQIHTAQLTWGHAHREKGVLIMPDRIGEGWSFYLLRKHGCKGEK